MYLRDPQGVEPAAIQSVVDLSGKQVLDVGCGPGRLTRFAARHARRVYAFDPSEEDLDMREWVDTVREVDLRLERVLEEGLFTIEEERRFMVEDRFADGAELLAASTEWRGCRMDDDLAGRLADEPSSAWLRWEVRLRVLRSAG